MVVEAHTRRLVLVAVCLGLFGVQFDTLALNLALPQIGKALGAGIGSLQWITDLYNLTYASLLLTGGVLGDRLGRKRVFVAGVSLFVVGSVVCAFSGSTSQLLIGRFVQGVGAAMEIPGTVAIISHTYPEPSERSRAMAIWAMVSGIAVAVGPSLGGWFVAQAGWQSIFVLNVPIGGIGLWFALTRIPADKTVGGDRALRIDLPGQLLAVVFLASLVDLVIGLGHGASHGWLTGICLAAAPIALLLFLLRETRTDDPMLPVGLFRAPALSGAVVGAGTMTFAMYGLLFILGIYLESVVGLSSFTAGLEFLASSVAFIIVSPIAGRIAGRTGNRPLMVAGLLFIAAGIYLLTGVVPNEGPFRLLAAMALSGVGMGLNTGPAVNVAVASVERSAAGLASGTVNLARMVGATMGVAVVGTVVAHNSADRVNQGLSGLATVRVVTFVGGMHEAFWITTAVLVGGAAVVAITVSEGYRRSERLTSLRRHAPEGTSDAHHQVVKNPE